MAQTRKPSDQTLMVSTMKQFPNLTPDQVLAAEMIAKKRGAYPSFEEIATACNMSARTLHRLRTDNRDFQEYIKQRVVADLICQLPELTEKLYQKAIENGSAKHLALAFEVAGLLERKIVITPALPRTETMEEIERSIIDLQAEITEYEKYQKSKNIDDNEEEIVNHEKVQF